MSEPVSLSISSRIRHRQFWPVVKVVCAIFLVVAFAMGLAGSVWVGHVSSSPAVPFDMGGFVGALLGILGAYGVALFQLHTERRQREEDTKRLQYDARVKLFNVALVLRINAARLRPAVVVRAALLRLHIVEPSAAKTHPLWEWLFPDAGGQARYLQSKFRGGRDALDLDLIKVLPLDEGMLLWMNQEFIESRLRMLSESIPYNGDLSGEVHDHALLLFEAVYIASNNLDSFADRLLSSIGGDRSVLRHEYPIADKTLDDLAALIIPDPPNSAQLLAALAQFHTEELARRRAGKRWGEP